MNAPEERKVRSLAELPREVQPARDLWPQIEARLERRPGATLAGTRAQRSPLARLRWLAAAAMVAAVAVGVWIGRDFPARQAVPVAQTTPVPAQQTQAPVAPQIRETSADLLFVSDPRYLHAREALLKSLQARLATMPPPAQEKVRKSLLAIEHAKEDLESALGKDPSNALLQELLINTYQDEMRALTDVHEASDPGRGI
jgi:hypothetical protein